MELAGLPYTSSDSRTSAVLLRQKITYRLVKAEVDLPLWKKVISEGSRGLEDISMCNKAH